MTDPRTALEEAYHPAQIEFMQQLFDRYCDNGGTVNLVDDHAAFLRIVMRNVPALAAACLKAKEAGDGR